MLVAPEPAKPTLAQGELTPVTELSPFLHPWQRADVASLVKLETTGVTPQRNDGELWNPTLIHKASIVAKLKDAGFDDLAKPLETCHTNRAWAECSGCGKVRMFWNRCENFYCPTCSPTLARERAQSIEWWTKEILQPKHIVLTARNTTTIDFQYVKWLKCCLTKLRRSRLCSNWRGGLWSMEVTNEGKGWHVHFHLLVDVPWVDIAEVAKKWGNLVGQDYAIVHVKDARRTEYLKEVCKYAVKGSQLASWSGADIALFVNAFQGQRTFGVFGSLYGKRTQWAEWIKKTCGEKRKCECGCERFEVYTDDQWRMHLRYLWIVGGKRGPDPDQLSFDNAPF